MQRAVVVVFIVAVAVIVLSPMLMLTVGSFRSEPPGATGASWTLRGWRSAYGNSDTVRAMWTTIRITVLSSLVSTFLALSMGWIVARTDTPGRTLIERLVFVPLLLPGVLMALAWSIVGSPRTGIISDYLEKLPGVGPEAFNISSEYGLIFVFGIGLAPLTFFLITPSLKAMDHTLEEAAVAAGAGRLRTVVRITLPMVAPAILGGATLSAIRVMESLEIPALLGQPAGIEVFMTRIFFAMRFTPFPDYAAATALGIAIVVITGILVYLQARYIRMRSYVTVGSRGTNAEVVGLGRWRYATAAYCWLYLFLTVAVPVGVVIIGSFERFMGLYEWNDLTLDNWREAFENRHLRSAIWNTLVIALASGFIMTATSAGLAYLIARSRSKLRWALEGMSWLPWSMPGVVLGVGLLWTYSFVPGGFYTSKWVLVIGYVTVLLPLGVRQCVAAISQIDPQLEEAARSSGSGPLRLATRIVIPLILKTIIATFLFGFVIGVREVGLPALLVSPGNEVLGSLTLYAQLEGRATDAAVYGVVMLTFSLVAVALLAILEHAVTRAQRRKAGTDFGPTVIAAE